MTLKSIQSIKISTKGKKWSFNILLIITFLLVSFCYTCYKCALSIFEDYICQNRSTFLRSTKRRLLFLCSCLLLYALEPKKLKKRKTTFFWMFFVGSFLHYNLVGIFTLRTLVVFHVHLTILN